MSGPIVLRSAGADDAAGIAVVHYEASRQSLAEVLPESVVKAFTQEKRRALWTGLFGSKRGRPSVEVVVREAAVLGFAWWRRVDAVPSAYDAEIVTIHVRPEAQRRGLGRRLMAHAAARMAEAGAGGCYLWVFEANAGARRFYEALGGRPVDRDRETYGTRLVPIVAYAWKPLEALRAVAPEDGSYGSWGEGA